MSSTIDVHSDRPGPEELPPLDHITVENEDAPDECALFPRDASEEALMTNWISALGESYVDLESMQ